MHGLTMTGIYHISNRLVAIFKYLSLFQDKYAIVGLLREKNCDGIKFPKGVVVIRYSIENVIKGPLDVRGLKVKKGSTENFRDQVGIFATSRASPVARSLHRLVVESVSHTTVGGKWEQS
jgi:hypothetical protein